jgi:hypothetical protein
MVGESTAITCRSTNDSNEQSAIPMQGTQVCQPRAGEVLSVAARMRVVAVEARTQVPSQWDADFVSLKHEASSRTFVTAASAR